MLLQIRTFIGRHLADPDLTPEVIARAHHISVRYLHKIFEGEDTMVGRWIRSRRLEACRRDLLHREAANRTIIAVAHRWGFHQCRPLQPGVQGRLWDVPPRVARHPQAVAAPPLEVINPGKSALGLSRATLCTFFGNLLPSATLASFA
ncbi:helix-turn-helix domain-containing protein [Streptomyces mirabilis]|uniref:helix-turn-helix domain-containing protein n=1 Tax=Streptomyces mirabilis TaxID=68239 RepID=UPI003F5DF90A